MDYTGYQEMAEQKIRFPVLYCWVAMHFKVREEGETVHKALLYYFGRGLDDILIACTDNLKGLIEAILSVFPKTEVQQCIVYQIRNSLKYVVSKDQKEFMCDATNPIEGYHRQIRKVAKTKGAFPSEMAPLKLVYLATQNIQKKWTSPLQNWSLTIQQLQ